jgi:hypothetical protein
MNCISVTSKKIPHRVWFLIQSFSFLRSAFGSRSLNVATRKLHVITQSSSSSRWYLRHFNPERPRSYPTATWNESPPFDCLTACTSCAAEGQAFSSIKTACRTCLFISGRSFGRRSNKDLKLFEPSWRACKAMSKRWHDDSWTFVSCHIHIVLI